MTKRWGGPRSGAGRPFRQRLKLSEEGGRNLALLKQRWQQPRKNPALREEEEIVEELIREALERTASLSPSEG